MLRRIGPFIELVFCFVSVSVYSGAYVNIPTALQGLDFSAGESNVVNALAMGILLIAVVVVLLLNWRRVIFVSRHGGAVNWFLLLSLISISWSEYPEISWRKWLILFQTIAFGYYLVARFPMHRIFRLWAFALFVALAASLVAALAIPSIGKTPASEVTIAGTWRGVYLHKNNLGEVGVLGVLTIGWLWAHEPKRRLRYGLGVLLAVFMVIMSQSKGSQITLVMIFSIVVCLPLFRLPGLAKIWGIYLTTLLISSEILIGFVYYTDIAVAIGKDPSLTGRVPVWTTLLDLGSQYALLGYGYSSFFVLGNPDVDYLWGIAKWTMWGAHNAYIDLFTQLGVPGVVLAIWALGEAIYRSLRAWSYGDLPWARFAAAYVISFTAGNAAETFLFRPGDIHCVMFSLVYVALRIDASTRVARAGAHPFRSGRPFDRLYGVGR